jgi:HlyD family secretion protein
VKKLIFFLVAALIGVVGVVYFLNRKGTAASLPPKTRMVDQGSITDKITVTGRTVPNPLFVYYVGTDALPAGKVVSVNPLAEVGNRVQEGDELAKLDDVYVKAQIDQAKAKKELAESNLKKAEAGRIRAESGQTRAKKAHTAARTAYDVAEKYLKEFKGKGEGEVRAQEKFDIAEQALNTAEAALKEADAGMQEAEAAKLAAEAQVNEAQVGITFAEKGLRPLTIKAPGSGVIIKKDVVKGQIVTPQATPVLFVIADLNQMQIIAPVGESDIGRVKIGQEVRFTVDAYSDVALGFTGRVSRIADIPLTTPLSSGGQKADPATLLTAPVLYSVVIDVDPLKDKPEFRLKAGLTANVDFVLREVKDALRVPSDALGYKPDQLTPEEEKLLSERIESNWKPLWVYRQGEKPQLVFVETGVTGDGKTEITRVDGKLEPGMHVIIEGPPPKENGGLFSGKVPLKL